MAPRAKASAETVEPTRRSTRISAQPKVESEPVKKAVPKPKKRAAAADDGEESEDAPAVKKVILQLPHCFYIESALIMSTVPEQRCEKAGGRSGDWC